MSILAVVYVFKKVNEMINSDENILMNYIYLKFHQKDEREKIESEMSSIFESENWYCRDELYSLFSQLLFDVPCKFWNREKAKLINSKLAYLFKSENKIILDETAIEYFIMAFQAYEQITEHINESSGLNYRPDIKTRNYRMPTYTSIVESCLSNLYRFIIRLLDQIYPEKNFKGANTLGQFKQTLQKYGFDEVVNGVDVNLRNAINHGRVFFREDGRLMEYLYSANRKTHKGELYYYQFDTKLDEVYDLASTLLLCLGNQLNENWDLIDVDYSSRSSVAFELLSLKFTSSKVKCQYIFESQNEQQVNVYTTVTDQDPGSIKIITMSLALMLYQYCPSYSSYCVFCSGDRLQTSWIRYSNADIKSMVDNFEEANSIIERTISSGNAMMFYPSSENIDMNEVMYFRFPNYVMENYKIADVVDVSIDELKRLKCNLYIGDETDKKIILQYIRESILWLESLKNVDSPKMHHKNGDMPADCLYINVYRNEMRGNKELFCTNKNFVCCVDYNISGTTILKNGGTPQRYWSQLHHEKIGKILVAWREKKYLLRCSTRIGRNECCPCGSGKKYKDCCLSKGLYD